MYFVESRFRSALKLIALCTSLVFSFNTVSWANGINLLSQGSSVPKTGMMAPGKQLNELVRLPDEYGSVKKTFQGSGDRVVIHIQEAHINEEAQLNIGNIIQHYAEKHGLQLVNLEGAEGVIETEIYSALTGKSARKSVADYFLKMGRLSGPEHLAVVENPSIILNGVEDKSLYEENRHSYLAVMHRKESVESVLAEFYDRIESLGRYVFSDDIRELHERRLASHQGGRELVSYVGHLAELAEKSHVDVAQYEGMQSLLDLVSLEREIAFEGVEKQLKEAVRVMKKKLPQTQLARFLSYTAHYHLKKISKKRYYAYLAQAMRVLGEKDSAFGEKYGNAIFYVEYLKLYQAVGSDLFTEIELLDQDVKNALLESEEARGLDRLYRTYDIYEKMFSFNITKQDLEYFDRHREFFQAEVIQETLQALLEKHHFSSDAPKELYLLDRHLPEVENFYAKAIERDHVMISRSVQKADEGHKISAIVAGGFHTPGIESYLEENNISYITIAPSITKAIDEKREAELYDDALRGTPLKITQALEQSFLKPKTAVLNDPRYQLSAWRILANDSEVSGELLILPVSHAIDSAKSVFEDAALPQIEITEELEARIQTSGLTIIVDQLQESVVTVNDSQSVVTTWTQKEDGSFLAIAVSQNDQADLGVEGLQTSESIGDYQVSVYSVTQEVAEVLIETQATRSELRDRRKKQTPAKKTAAKKTSAKRKSSAKKSAAKKAAAKKKPSAKAIQAELQANARAFEESITLSETLLPEWYSELVKAVADGDLASIDTVFGPKGEYQKRVDEFFGKDGRTEGSFKTRLKALESDPAIGSETIEELIGSIETQIALIEGWLASVMNARNAFQLLDLKDREEGMYVSALVGDLIDFLNEQNLGGQFLKTEVSNIPFIDFDAMSTKSLNKSEAFIFSKHLNVKLEFFISSVESLFGDQGLFVDEEWPVLDADSFLKEDFLNQLHDEYVPLIAAVAVEALDENATPENVAYRANMAPYYQALLEALEERVSEFSNSEEVVKNLNLKRTRLVNTKILYQIFSQVYGSLTEEVGVQYVKDHANPDRLSKVIPYMMNGGAAEVFNAEHASKQAWLTHLLILLRAAKSYDASDEVEKTYENGLVSHIVKSLLKEPLLESAFEASVTDLTRKIISSSDEDQETLKISVDHVIEIHGYFKEPDGVARLQIEKDPMALGIDRLQKATETRRNAKILRSEFAKLSEDLGSVLGTQDTAKYVNSDRLTEVLSSLLNGEFEVVLDSKHEYPQAWWAHLLVLLNTAKNYDSVRLDGITEGAETQHRLLADMVEKLAESSRFKNALDESVEDLRSKIENASEADLGQLQTSIQHLSQLGTFFANTEKFDVLDDEEVAAENDEDLLDIVTTMTAIGQSYFSEAASDLLLAVKARPVLDDLIREFDEKALALGELSGLSELLTRRMVQRYIDVPSLEDVVEFRNDYDAWIGEAGRASSTFIEQMKMLQGVQNLVSQLDRIHSEKIKKHFGVLLAEKLEGDIKTAFEDMMAFLNEEVRNGSPLPAVRKLQQPAVKKLEQGANSLQGYVLVTDAVEALNQLRNIVERPEAFKGWLEAYASDFLLYSVKLMDVLPLLLELVAIDDDQSDALKVQHQKIRTKFQEIYDVVRDPDDEKGMVVPHFEVEAMKALKARIQKHDSISRGITEREAVIQNFRGKRVNGWVQKFVRGILEAHARGQRQFLTYQIEGVGLTQDELYIMAIEKLGERQFLLTREVFDTAFDHNLGDPTWVEDQRVYLLIGDQEKRVNKRPEAYKSARVYRYVEFFVGEIQTQSVGNYIYGHQLRDRLHQKLEFIGEDFDLHAFREAILILDDSEFLLSANEAPSEDEPGRFSFEWNQYQAWKKGKANKLKKQILNGFVLDQEVRSIAEVFEEMRFMPGAKKPEPAREVAPAQSTGTVAEVLDVKEDADGLEVESPVVEEESHAPTVTEVIQERSGFGAKLGWISIIVLAILSVGAVLYFKWAEVTSLLKSLSGKDPVEEKADQGAAPPEPLSVAPDLNYFGVMSDTFLAEYLQPLKRQHLVSWDRHIKGASNGVARSYFIKRDLKTDLEIDGQKVTSLNFVIEFFTTGNFDRAEQLPNEPPILPETLDEFVGFSVRAHFENGGQTGVFSFTVDDLFHQRDVKVFDLKGTFLRSDFPAEQEFVGILKGALTEGIQTGALDSDTPAGSHPYKGVLFQKMKWLKSSPRFDSEGLFSVDFEGRELMLREHDVDTYTEEILYYSPQGRAFVEVKSDLTSASAAVLRKNGTFDPSGPLAKALDSVGALEISSALKQFTKLEIDGNKDLSDVDRVTLRAQLGDPIKIIDFNDGDFDNRFKLLSIASAQTGGELKVVYLGYDKLSAEQKDQLKALAFSDVRYDLAKAQKDWRFSLDDGVLFTGLDKALGHMENDPRARRADMWSIYSTMTEYRVGIIGTPKSDAYKVKAKVDLAPFFEALAAERRAEQRLQTSA